MSRAAEAREDSALEIKFGPLDLAQVRIRTVDPGAILDELTGRVATAPRFFQRTAVGLDLSLLDAQPGADEIRVVVDAVRRAGMLPIGLVTGPAFIDPLARTLELPVLAQFRATNKPPPVLGPVEPLAAAEPAQDEPATHDGPLAHDGEPDSQPRPEPDTACALLHHLPVRSGQRLYARRRDLIVTATVGAGAEVMADGCVHIYGALRGRAMAGARGETAARVFCQEFRAELVSVAGVFRVFETLPAELAGRPVQVWLDGDDLRIERMG
jgi:septum site-determining protein MinC